MCDCSVNCRWVAEQDKILARAIKESDIDVAFIAGTIKDVLAYTCVLKKGNKVLGYGMAFKNPIDVDDPDTGMRISYKRAVRMYGNILGLEGQWLKEFESNMRKARYEYLQTKKIIEDVC